MRIEGDQGLDRLCHVKDDGMSKYVDEDYLYQERIKFLGGSGCNTIIRLCHIAGAVA